MGNLLGFRPLFEISKFFDKRNQCSSSCPVKTLSFLVRVSQLLALIRCFLLSVASPSKPSSTAAVNPDPSSSPTAEEEVEVNAPGKFVPVLKWTKSSFKNLMTTIQMPAAYGARYPQEGDIAGDAPAGYVSMFADWFDACNLRLPLTGFHGGSIRVFQDPHFSTESVGNGTCS
ncbi:hypothetical protein Hanom_Chr01g00054801 [Helianthus anomalus]